LKNSNQYIYKSILSSPLYIDGEFFGCIGVDNIETTNAFSKEDIEIIKYISVHLEIVIKNMLLVDKIKHSLITDPLTGLSNRRYYNTLVDCDFNNRNLLDTVFAMIDMDNFKAVNDTYGHLKGDEALRYFSELLKSRFRKDDTIIRYAGDEFLLIIYDFDVESVKKKLGDIIKELDNNPFCGIKISFSYGVSRFAAGTGAEEAIKQADRNMYHQKSSKRAI
jgi:diguanylate cyclase (GGDEF)-like protein